MKEEAYRQALREQAKAKRERGLLLCVHVGLAVAAWSYLQAIAADITDTGFWSLHPLPALFVGGIAVAAVAFNWKPVPEVDPMDFES